MTRPLFLDNPRRRWTETVRQSQTPAEYASSVHRMPVQSGYPVLWWAVVIACGAVGLYFA